MADLTEWFDGSVITTPSGSPLPVYHGSPYPGFEEFSFEVERQTGHEAGTIGAWFTSDLRVASRFAYKWEGEYYETGETWPDGEKKKFHRDVLQTGLVYICYLKMLNPAWYGSDESDGFEDMMDDRDAFAAYIDKLTHAPYPDGWVRQQGRLVRTVAPPGYWRKRMMAYDAHETNIDFRMYLEALGHDGIVIQNTMWDSFEDEPQNQFVVWDSSQIWIADQINPADVKSDLPTGW